MKERPILMSTPMVQAILEGRKTQTRRSIKSRTGLFQVCTASYEPDANFFYHNKSVNSINDEEMFVGSIFCPYGEVGDTLWVRETFVKSGYDERYFYKADMGNEYQIINHKWKPSIFMPRQAARIFLEITDIKVERLQDISQADASAEGVAHVIDKITGYCGYDYMSGGYNLMTSPYNGFRSLGRKINGEERWNENPFVWAITFKNK